jgi:DNA polymerase-3 subunit delta'
MSWDSIIGQKRIKGILMSALRTGRMPHAYLFHGPKGTGKEAVAIELAKVVNCESGIESACDECESCRMFRALQHPNVALVFAIPTGKGEKKGDPPLAKLTPEDIGNIQEQIRRKAENPYIPMSIPRATAIKVNSIRDVKREASLTTYRKGKKVILIIDADLMNDESSNALLKTLEEPTDDTLLILTTAYRDQILPTVASRCQPVRFDALTEDDISLYLERRGIEPSRAQLVSRLAHGSIARALDLLGVDLQERRDRVVSFLRVLRTANVLDVVKTLEEMAKEYDREEVVQYLHVLQLWIRDALYVKEGHDSIVNIDQRETLERFVRAFPDMDYDRVLTRIDQAVFLVTRNAYIPLVLVTLSIDIMKSITASVHETLP